MSYPFRQAAHDYGPRKGPALAVLVHMAEGGGTVGYLAGAPARGVSVHYVVEYSGRVVQMLLEDHASGSVNPLVIRTDDDPDGFYGASAADAVMGAWSTDPNAACISIEIEGFAAAGPNPDQVAGLVELVDGIRARHPGVGLLGHRDFAAYKACPGQLIPWAQLGGHGRQEDPVKDIDIVHAEPVMVDIPAGAKILNPDGSARLTAPTARTAFSPFTTTSIGGTILRAIVWTSAAPAPDLLLAVYANVDPDPRPVGPPDCSAAIADAVAAEHTRTKQAAVAAVEAIP